MGTGMPGCKHGGRGGVLWLWRWQPDDNSDDDSCGTYEDKGLSNTSFWRGSTCPASNPAPASPRPLPRKHPPLHSGLAKKSKENERRKENSTCRQEKLKMFLKETHTKQIRYCCLHVCGCVCGCGCAQYKRYTLCSN